MTRILIALFLFIGLSTCRTTSSGVKQAGQLQYAHNLTNDNMYQLMVDGPGFDQAYLGYIKFTIALDENGQFDQVYFQSYDYQFHIDFLKTLPQYRDLDPAQLDQLALHNQGRQFYIGSVVIGYGEGPDARFNYRGLVQILGYDNLPPQTVKGVMDYIKSRGEGFLAGTEYFPATEQTDYVEATSTAFEAAGIKISMPFKSSDSICYAQGWTAGRLRQLNSDQLEGELRAGRITVQDILLMDRAPRDLPILAGLIVGQPSSPSSHAALLAEMTGTPFFYQKDAGQDPLLNQLLASREPLFMTAYGVDQCATFYSRPGSISATDFSELINLRKPKKLNVSRPYESMALQVEDLTSIGPDDTAKYGAKAVNVAKLIDWIPENTVSGGLAIPIGLFYQFQKNALYQGQQLDVLIRDEIARIQPADVPLDQVIVGLDKIRKAIKKADETNQSTIIATLVGQIERRFGTGKRVKLRSSSNLEDEPNFNGAGIYDSKGACTGDDGIDSNARSLCASPDETDPDELKRDMVGKSIRGVWRSFYSLKAFLARRHFRVDENKVGMGILVHSSFQGEKANGVAISKQIYDHNDELYDTEVSSTGFKGEDLSVVDAPAGFVPETVKISNQGEQIRVVVASRQLDTGRTVLDSKENYLKLYKMIEKVHSEAVKSIPRGDRNSFELDLEWKWLANGEIIIKQFRPIPKPAEREAASGTTLVGHKSGMLCPGPSEQADAMYGLATSYQFHAEVSQHTVPTVLPATIPNPVRSLAFQDDSNAQPVAVGFPDQVNVSASPWRQGWQGSWMRSVKFSFPFNIPGRGGFTFKWEVEERQNKKRVLEKPVRSAAFISYQISPDRYLSTWSEEPIVPGERSHRTIGFLFTETNACEQHAFQGLQPGTIARDSAYLQNRTPPVPAQGTYVSEDGQKSVSMEMRTSVQGFDKTVFFHIDKATIKGLVPDIESLTITNPLASHYAGAHHNFTEQYAFDLHRAEGLTDEQRQSLPFRWIVFPALSMEDRFDPANVQAIGMRIDGTRVSLGKLTGSQQIDRNHNGGRDLQPFGMEAMAAPQPAADTLMRSMPPNRSHRRPQKSGTGKQ